MDARASSFDVTSRVVGSLVIDKRAKLVTCEGKRVPLTATEYAVVALLAEHPGWVISGEDIASSVTGFASYSNSVSVHIAHIRKKLAGCCPEQPIETVRGLGYRLRCPGDTGHRVPGQSSSVAPLVLAPRLNREALDDALARARSGRFSSMLLLGDTGAGKTALLHDIQDELHEDGWLTSIVDCRVTHGIPSLAPWRLLLHSLGIGGDESRFPSRNGHVIDLCHASAAIAHLLSAMASRRPVLAAFDSADFLDSESLRVLGHVAASFTTGPLFLIAAGRDVEGTLADMFGAHAQFQQRMVTHEVPNLTTRLQDVSLPRLHATRPS